MPYQRDFFEAVQFGRVEQIKELITAGADINAKNPEGWGALHYAVQNRDIAVVHLLLSEKNINVNITNFYNVTPLHMAANNCHLEIVKALIAAKADINIKRKDGLTALLLAAQHVNSAIIIFLLQQKNILINSPNDNNANVLHFLDRDGLPNFTNQLRVGGALEWRSYDTNGWQSIHDPHTEVSIKNSIIKLSADKTPQMIENAYVEFVAYIASPAFSVDIEEISQTPFGEGWIGEYTKSENTTAQQRAALLKRVIAGEGEYPSYIDRVMHHNNSESVKKNFKTVAGLVWLAIHDTEHLIAIKHIKNTPCLDDQDTNEVVQKKIDIELKDIRHNLWKRIVSIQYEYLQPGQSVEAYYPACAPGTINHHLAILNQIHEQVRVSNQPETPVVNKDSSLKLQLLANGYVGLTAVIVQAFQKKEALLCDIVDVLSIEGCTHQMYTSFLANTNLFPRTVSTQFALEKLLGTIKASFQHESRLAHLELEDALREMPFMEIMQVLLNLKKEICEISVTSNPSYLASSASIISASEQHIATESKRFSHFKY